MPSSPNYLLGQGERLTDYVPFKPGGRPKKMPYSFGEAQKSLMRKVLKSATAIAAIPDAACPDDEAVAILTLHPEFLAKSSYPHLLLDNAGLRPLGSRSVVVTPAKLSSKQKPVRASTAELFVAGKRAAFSQLPQVVQSFSATDQGSDDIRKVEDFRVASAPEKIKPIHGKATRLLFELVLHAGSGPSGERIVSAFEHYLEALKISGGIEDRIDTEELSFLSVYLGRAKLEEVAQFSFLRLAREMPRLRPLKPSKGVSPPKKHPPFWVSLPVDNVVDPTIRVATFDGGMPDVRGMRRYVDRYDEDVLGPVREYERHGLAVTSALLFGPLTSGVTPPVPFAKVDHYRVLDEDTRSDPQHELYPVLRRIVTALEREHYDFVNLSIGPDIPTEDDDVHPWTAKLDPLFASGKTLATVAVGNTGEQDAATGLNRIQPPGDAVNVFSLGAADTLAKKWGRASYSSVGHRSRVKPDALAFGGVDTEPFWVVDYDDPLTASAIWGTSFASPYALHAAIGVRAILGQVLTPLATKAILLHSCKRRKGHSAAEVGWGRIDTDIETLISSGDSTAHIVYQGDIEPRKYLRAQIPMPRFSRDTKVAISATICFATDTDPSHPVHYARSGLDIAFRPDRGTIPEGRKTPATKRFFSGKPGSLEIKLRRDAHKWETSRQASRRFNASILKDPVFDIHFNAREGGKDAVDPHSIPYAMVISIHSPETPDLYQQVVAKYGKLRPMVPRVKIQVRR